MQLVKTASDNLANAKTPEKREFWTKQKALHLKNRSDVVEKFKRLVEGDGNRTRAHVSQEHTETRRVVVEEVSKILDTKFKPLSEALGLGDEKTSQMLKLQRESVHAQEKKRRQEEKDARGIAKAVLVLEAQERKAAQEKHKIPSNPPAPPPFDAGLPHAKVGQDGVFVVPDFMQKVLGVDPAAVWEALHGLPVWDSEKPLEYDPHAPCIVPGSHSALNYRGHAIKRHKFWGQTDLDAGLRKYRYTGWQWKIALATKAIETVPLFGEVLQKLNEGLTQKANHVIATVYNDGDDNIDWHDDKMENINDSSWIVVLKLGASRKFEFGTFDKSPETVWSETLAAGTAVFMNARGNSLVKHRVPVDSSCSGASGSLVLRCIDTVVPWEHVFKEAESRMEPAEEPAPKRRKGPVDPQTFRCELCEKSFPTQKVLDKHMGSKVHEKAVARKQVRARFASLLLPAPQAETEETEEKKRRRELRVKKEHFNATFGSDFVGVSSEEDA